jgi:hypothetical protein
MNLFICVDSSLHRSSGNLQKSGCCYIISHRQSQCHALFCLVNRSCHKEYSTLFVDTSRRSCCYR